MSSSPGVFHRNRYAGRGRHETALQKGAYRYRRAAEHDLYSGLAKIDYLTNENIFDLTELPRRLLVIGGGPLGCELAQAFCRFGAQTIIAQEKPLFLPKEERDAAQLLSDALRATASRCA